MTSCYTECGTSPDKISWIKVDILWSITNPFHPPFKERLRISLWLNFLVENYSEQYVKLKKLPSMPWIVTCTKVAMSLVFGSSHSLRMTQPQYCLLLKWSKKYLGLKGRHGRLKWNFEQAVLLEQMFIYSDILLVLN